jgi:DNA repair ATPase RecN
MGLLRRAALLRLRDDLKTFFGGNDMVKTDTITGMITRAKTALDKSRDIEGTFEEMEKIVDDFEAEVNAAEKAMKDLQTVVNDVEVEFN